MTHDLEQKMRDEFGASKRAWTLIVSLQLVWLLAALAGEALKGAWTPLVQLITAASLPLALSMLRSSADGHFRIAEALRRALRLAKGLGLSPTPSQRAELAASATARVGGEPTPLGDYYSSARSEGPDRLAHLVQEETFYSKDLAAISSSIAWVGVVVMIAAAFTIMYGALHLAATGLLDGQLHAHLANASLAVVGLGVSGTLIELARSYSGLADAAKVAYEQAKALADRRDARLVDLLPVIAAYDCTLAASPPIPTLIYRLNRARLDAAWRTAHGPSDSTPRVE